MLPDLVRGYLASIERDERTNLAADAYRGMTNAELAAAGRNMTRLDLVGSPIDRGLRIVMCERILASLEERG